MQLTSLLEKPTPLRKITKNNFELLLRDFSCRRHPLVESFLKKSAWEFEQRGIVRTYLWIGSQKPLLRGFITLGIFGFKLLFEDNKFVVLYGLV